jgi:hypothetical protein
MNDQPEQVSEGGGCMPPRGVTSPKQKRQYEHIKDSELKEGRSTARAKQIAAATINKQRAEAGQTKTSGRKAAGGGRKKAAGGRKKSSGGRSAAARKTGGRKSAARKSSRKTTRSRKTSTRGSSAKKK